jgi:hypothetical protein
VVLHEVGEQVGPVADQPAAAGRRPLELEDGVRRVPDQLAGESVDVVLVGVLPVGDGVEDLVGERAVLVLGAPEELDLRQYGAVEEGAFAGGSWLVGVEPLAGHVGDELFLPREGVDLRTIAMGL